MVLIGIGSNRGDSVAIVRAAMAQLQSFAAGPVRCSSLWRTSPVDCPPDSADFVNAAAAFVPRSGLTPEALLQGLKELERAYGRDPAPLRNAPRELDLDLLLFGDQQRDEPGFVLPHPRAVNRLFVLAPAAEVLPQSVWPGTGCTVNELLVGLQPDEQVERMRGPQLTGMGDHG
jgi:2-amino-4-hydroxy-6-hydroxymethyldihydropteridine diphosphokinase